METGKSTSQNKIEIAKPLIYEFCGTTLIVLAFNLTMGNFLGRAFVYFIGYMIAVQVSGAHFNPATTLAVYIVEQKYKANLTYLGLAFISQFLGGLTGLLFTYLLAKNYLGYQLYPGFLGPS